MESVIKKKVLFVLSTLLILFTTLAIVFNINASKVSAQSSFKTTEIEMRNGAYVYIGSADTLSGIKYECQTSEVKDGYTYGMTIIPYDYFLRTNIDIDDDIDYIKHFSDAKANNEIPKDILVKELAPAKKNPSDEYYSFSLAMDNILPNNYDRRFVGIGFIKNSEGYKYTDIKDSQVRDISYIASVALDKYGDSYSSDQKAEMKTLINKGVSNALGENSFSMSITGETTAKVGDIVKLSLTLPSGVRLYPTWSVQDEEYATISENGELTVKKAGNIVVNASVIDNTYQATPFTITATEYEVESNEVVKINNTTSLANFNGYGGADNLNKEYVSSNDLTSVYGISGEYTGNAVKVTGSGFIGISITPRIAKEEFKTKLDAGYTNIVLYIAAYSDGDGVLIYSPAQNESMNTSQIEYSTTWTKVTISITEDNYGIFYDYSGTINRVLNVLYYGGTNHTTTTIFISDVMFDEDSKIPAVIENEVVAVHNAYALNLIQERYDRDAKEFVSSSDLTSTYGLSGNYNGNAVKIQTGPIRQISITPRITKEEVDEKIINGYQKITFWLAAVAQNGKSVYIRQDNTIYTATSVVKLSNTWQKFEIYLDEAVSQQLYSPTENPLFGIYMDGSDVYESDGTTQTKVNVFVGDVMFDEDSRTYPVESNEVVKINNATSLANFNGYGGTGALNDTFVSSTELSSVYGISGEYTGNAVKVTSSDAIVGISINPRITKEEFKAKLDAGYTNIVLYIAGYSDTSGVSVYTYRNDTNAIYTTATDIYYSKTWTKITIPVNEDNYETFYDYSGTINRVIRVHQWTSSGNNYSFNTFISDVMFDEASRTYPVEENEVVKIHDANALDNFNGYGGADNLNKEYVSSSDLTSVYGISGEYTGNAVKVTGSGFIGISITPRITKEEFKAKLDAGYTNIVLYIAAYSNGDGVLIYSPAQNESMNTSQIEYSTTWTKVTISITEDNYGIFYDYSGTINRVLNVLYYGGTNHTTTTIFIGDVMFEKPNA